MNVTALPAYREAPDVASSTPGYASRFAGGVGEYFLEVQLRAVTSFMPPPTEGRVLDVGGGHAQLAPPLTASGYNVTVLGSDASCRQQLDASPEGGRIEFVAGNLLALPFESDSFSTVLAFRMLPHLERWEQFLGELCRVSSSAVILDYPDVRSVNWFSSRMFAVKQRIEENARTYRCFRQTEVRSVLEGNGFDVQRSFRQFALPMALHRLMRTPRLSAALEALARRSFLTAVFGSPVILKAVK